MLVSVDVAAMLLQLQRMATGWVVGVDDIGWDGRDGYELPMDAI